jgi:hypothetical protein
MTDFNQKEYQTVILAALLHDHDIDHDLSEMWGRRGRIWIKLYTK